MSLKRMLMVVTVILLNSFFLHSVQAAYENVGNMFGIDPNSNPTYKSYNPFCLDYCGQCTAFAWGRAMDRLGLQTTFKNNSERHACRWWLYEYVTNAGIKYETNPRENSFVIWANANGECCRTSPCTSPTGHVAYVEKVENGFVYINEANIATYKPTNEGGGYDGFTKKFTISDIANRPKAGGELKGYIYLPNPFKEYHYWDFDNQGTEDWNARNALNQGIALSNYWQIGTSFDDNSQERGIVSPILSNINTDTYRAIKIKFGINN